jgi:hypothetical protein
MKPILYVCYKEHNEALAIFYIRSSLTVSLNQKEGLMKNLIFASMFGVLFVSGASAEEMQCAQRQAFVEKLSSVFHETQEAVGVINGQTILEIFISPQGKTWTVIATGADGYSCLLYSGKDWQQDDSATALPTTLQH